MLVLNWRMQFRKAIDLLNLILLERKIKMNATSFTSEQATRANNVVLRMMRARRIFTAKDCALDPKIFAECLSLMASLRGEYKVQEFRATQQLAKIEENLGFAPPVIKENQSIVRCPIFSSGMEICDVFPIQKFLPFIPESFEILLEEMLTLWKNTPGSLSHKNQTGISLGNYKLGIKTFTEDLWSELETIKKSGDKLVLVMRTKFQPTFEEGFEILDEKVGNMVFEPTGLAYLFFKNECAGQSVKYDHILFSTDRTRHTCLQHWPDGQPKLFFENYGGYVFQTKFACFV